MLFVCLFSGPRELPCCPNRRLSCCPAPPSARRPPPSPPPPWTPPPRSVCVSVSLCVCLCVCACVMCYAVVLSQLSPSMETTVFSMFGHCLEKVHLNREAHVCGSIKNEGILICTVKSVHISCHFSATSICNLV